MARPSSKDPLDRFRWSVSVEGFTRMGFTSCDVPGYNINTKKYAEGGAHIFPRQIVDTIEYKPVTLTRGVTSDTSFQDWASQPIEFASGITKKVRAPSVLDAFSEEGFQVDRPTAYRRDVIINHLNRNGDIVKSYKLYNAMPIEYVPASTFSADGDDAISMERLTLVYESFEVISNATDSNPFDIRGAFKRLTRRT